MSRILSVLILIAALYSCKSDKKITQAGPGGNMPQQVLEVEAMVVKTSSIEEIVEVSGTILANESTEIRPEISGRIVQLNLKEGVIVPKGSLLVKIYDGDLQAELKKLQVQLQIANKTEERQKELLAIGGIAQQDYDLSLLQVSNIKADIELTQVAINKTEIRAPYTGRLGLKNISPGAYVTPSTLLTTITEVEQMKIEFSVPEKYSSQIKNGMPIDFSIEGSDKTYKAYVLAKESYVDEATRNLRIRAVVQNIDAYMVPGSFAKVNMILGRNDNAMMIPSNAVIPQARNKQVAVFRGGLSAMTDITTGVRDSSMIQVTSGLNPGDTVITTGLLFVKNDSKIKLTKIVN
ncbi:MAG TPA: efflux RND transporter periplasmic adaptor subunit [Chitinophagaceae bacterium]|nr:efflux RND transporter periplasmic adaptor subunit [Chitinophagaceae bacterium]